MLPLPDEEERQRTNCKKNILVAVTGSPQDRELIALASNIGKTKKVEVFAVYGIEVPRTLPVDAEMPVETQQATEALDRATAVAAKLDVHVDPEIIQSRSFGQTLVDEAEAHGCALLVIGLPYHVGRNGHFTLDDTADYVLKNAPCRVWMVREQPPEQPETTDGDEKPKA